MKNISGSPDSGSSGARNGWPVFRSLNSYRTQFLTHDLFAGLTLAAIAIPEQMATARLGGVRHRLLLMSRSSFVRAKGRSFVPARRTSIVSRAGAVKAGRRASPAAGA